MGLLDGVLGSAMGGPSQALGGGGQGALLQAAVQMLSGGGLQSLIQSFQQKGLGDLVGSWISTGANLPASAEQITHALGADRLGQLAQQTGLHPNDVAGHLSGLLPGLVDRMTPQGNVPDAGSLEGLLQGALGGLLGR